MQIMAGEFALNPEQQIEHIAAVFEAALGASAMLGETTPADLAQIHVGAARLMVEAGKMAEIAAVLGPPEDPELPATSTDELQRRWHAYGLTMLAAERAIDGRNPDVQPPLSQTLRTIARKALGDDIDRYMPAFTNLSFTDADPQG